MRYKPVTLALITTLFISGATSAQRNTRTAVEPGLQAARNQWEAVAGHGVHYFTTGIVHSSEPTATGVIQRSTETVELSGDLEGRILYHPVSVFDFVEGTLVNTGHQVFSGTVLGSDPVLIHDDEFRFEVDLETGVTFGEVHLVDRIAGPRIRCRLQVYGTGQTTPEGDAMFEYTGECKISQRQFEAGQKD